MDSYDVSFIIIEYYCIENVKNCIQSIKDMCNDISYECIVTSNSNYSAEEQNTISKEFNKIKWIFNKKNLGFAKAMNVGITSALGKSIIIINPDVKILNKEISSAYNYLMNNTDVGIIGPKIVDKDGNIQDSCRKFLTPVDLIIRIYKRFFLNKYVLLDPDFDYNKLQKVDWVIGAFMMVKREAFEKVGLLDDKYFLYVEDMDWCKRFWDCKYKVIYYPDLIIAYKGDRKSIAPMISKRFINRYTLYHLKSYLRFLKKYRLFFRIRNR